MIRYILGDWLDVGGRGARLNGPRGGGVTELQTQNLGYELDTNTKTKQI